MKLRPYPSLSLPPSLCLPGASEHGLAGFVLGAGRGLVGAVARPVAGALGAVSSVAESVDASTHYWDKRPIGRRRVPRAPRAEGEPS